MPGYPWSCAVCGANVGADLDACPACGAPAELTGEEIEQRRRTRAGLPPKRRMPPRVMGWIFLGVYLGVLALIVAFIVSPASSDMSGLLLVLPALPWALLGHWLLGQSWGLGIGTLVGLPLNGVLAYLIGYWIGRWRTRT